MEKSLVSRRLINHVRLFYITRSYAPYDAGGGALMRKWTVDYLTSLGWDVRVVRPEYGENAVLSEENVLSIPFNSKYRQKWFSTLERIGWYEDYLDPWVTVAFPHLKTVIRKEDMILSTSGGELGTIKLGALIKDEIGCKLVVNFRDPLNYGYMQGLRRDKKPHVGRIGAQRKYLNAADLILTSSQKYCDILNSGFPELKNKLHNNYFGFGKLPCKRILRKRNANQYTIAYAGNLSGTQKPDFILDVIRNQNFQNLKVVFIGDIAGRKFDLSGVNCEVEFIKTLPHDQFQRFMQDKVDIGLVSLSKDYYGACVPSKLYEYLSLDLPILGFLPEGDAAEIVNQNGFGIATKWGDIETARNALRRITTEPKLAEFIENVTANKECWSMKHRINELDDMLRAVLKAS